MPTTTHRGAACRVDGPSQRASCGAQGSGAWPRGESRPITTEWLGYCIGQFQREAPDCVFVDESLTSHAAVWNHLDTDEPGTMFGSGGSSLGWGLGAALGIKLARPDRPVVLVVGDGSFVFGEPLAALWASQMNQRAAAGGGVQQRLLQREQGAARSAPIRRATPFRAVTSSAPTSRRRLATICWRPSSAPSGNGSRIPARCCRRCIAASITCERDGRSCSTSFSLRRRNAWVRSVRLKPDLFPRSGLGDHYLRRLHHGRHSVALLE